MIFALWLSAEMIDYAKQKNIRIIIDLYSPVPVEELVVRYYAGRTDAAEAYTYSELFIRHYRTRFQIQLITLFALIKYKKIFGQVLLLRL